MDTSIYTWLGLQRFSHTINVLVNTSSSQKTMEEYCLKFGYCLDDICFKPLNVMYPQLAEAYIYKEMTDLHECISYPPWQ